MKFPDEIHIRRLAVQTFIGVPDEERAAPQTLWISVILRPSQGFDGLQDQVSFTIDYYEVSLRLEELAEAKPRHLIETLATDIADFLIGNYSLSSVRVEVEKRILPHADYVSVSIDR